MSSGYDITFYVSNYQVVVLSSSLLQTLWEYNILVNNCQVNPIYYVFTSTSCSDPSEIPIDYTNRK